MPSPSHSARVLVRGLAAVALGFVLALSGAAAPAHAGTDPRAGQFVWTPQIAPEGPLVIVVSLPAQQAHVYRNGARIGVAPVSTGRAGYETPPGVYTILQKHREHYSNLYDAAPMPFMQRLTWDGLALHAGVVPGYPASHGCIRLPPRFAEALYRATRTGTVVVIAREDLFPPTVTSPGLFAPVDALSGAVVRDPDVQVPYSWTPERAPAGPLTVLLSTSDRRVVVVRNAVEIGRAELEVSGELPRGTRAYVLLDGNGEGSSRVLPERPALRWMAIALEAPAFAEAELQAAMIDGRLRIPAEFARRLYDSLAPGATVVITDEPLRPAQAVMVMSTDGAEPLP